MSLGKKIIYESYQTFYHRFAERLINKIIHNSFYSLVKQELFKNHDLSVKILMLCIVYMILLCASI